MARSSLAQAVEAQEIACNVLHALLDLRLCACPLCRTQAAQRWNRVTHANVACDPVKLVGRDVELVGARVANQEIFTLNARCAQPDKPLEASNTSAILRACAVTMTTRPRPLSSLRQSCTKARRRPPYELALPNMGMRCSVPPCWYASNSPSEAESIPAKRNCRRC